ncbi:tetratricopeptide repeat protein [Roseovarius sp. CAU 1744]
MTSDDPVSLFAAGQIYYNLGDEEKALDCMRRAGELGVGSASYAAAKLLEEMPDLEQSTEAEILRLKKNACKNGNLKACWSVLKTQKSGPFSTAKYWVYRYVYVPIMVVKIKFTDAHSDRIR